MTRSLPRPSRPGRSWAPRAAAALLAATVVALPAVAAAHVTIQPGEVEGGGSAVVAFRVPNERDDASTTRVRVVLPEDQPLGSVRTTPTPGWEVAVENRTLAEPIEVYGEPVDSVVSEVTWTATDGGVGPGEYVDLELSLGPLPESGEMVFPTVQTYSSGEEVTWNETAVDDAVEPEHPAPVLTITPAEGDDAGHSSAGSPTAEESPTAWADAESAGDVEGSATSAPTGSADPTGSMLPTLLAGGALLVSLVALALVVRRRS